MRNIDIVRHVARDRGVPSSLIVGGASHRRIVAARVECVRVIKKINSHTLPETLADLFAVTESTVRRYLKQAGVTAVRRRYRLIADPGEARPLDVIAQVAAWSGVPVESIMGAGRTAAVAAARGDAMRAVHARCVSLSVTDIGRVFKRDHTTVCHALGRLKRRRQSSPAAAA